MKTIRRTSGRSRAFMNFRAMAREVSVSRLNGDIPFEEAISLARKQGYQIGKNINEPDLNR
ncbi:MAG: hypothetical protein WBG48_10820 [Pricia sp.]